MPYFLAAFPILFVLALMLIMHWSGQLAGPVGWAAGLLVGILAFGVTPSIIWVSQLKGLFLSLFVLAVLWPALFLYNIVDQVGGIRAMAVTLEQTICDRGILLITLAWAFSGMLEGLAGFGLPIAIVAPMLASLGVAPVVAVAAVAVGHAWSVTFGDMGVIYQTLIAVVKMDGATLAPASATLLGAACIACGIAAARVLGQSNRARFVIVIGLVMAGSQLALALLGLAPLATLGAGLAGVLGALLYNRRPGIGPARNQNYPALTASLVSYGSLAMLLTTIALVAPLRSALDQVSWQMSFPEVVTVGGFVTPAGPGQLFKFLTHPGTSIFLVACASYLAFTQAGLCTPGSWKKAAQATWHSAAPSSVGILSMVGLATLMDHAGMTMMLAQAMAGLTGAAFPIVSPLVGILGAFATGSNNNSNVLFGSLQKNAALLLGIDPRFLIAAQTTGGSLGSMIAPAKILVGCSTVGIKGKEGEVLRQTLPYGLVIGLLIGVLALFITRF